MPNETLEQLEKTVASDEFDTKSGLLVRKLREQWDLAEAAENLREHVVIKAFLRDFQEAIKDIDKTLQDQEVKTQEDISYRFELQATKLCYTKFLSIFDGTKKKSLEQQIENYSDNTKG